MFLVRYCLIILCVASLNVGSFVVLSVVATHFSRWPRFAVVAPSLVAYLREFAQRVASGAIGFNSELRAVSPFLLKAELLPTSVTRGIQVSVCTLPCYAASDYPTIVNVYEVTIVGLPRC